MNRLMYSDYSAQKDRVILHCDLNNYFASVELLEKPELREKPVIVGGSTENRHGIYGKSVRDNDRRIRFECPRKMSVAHHT